MKNQVFKKFVTSIPSSDRVIFLEFNEEKELIGINYQQGLDSIDRMDWQQNDKVLYTMLDCISSMFKYNTEDYSLGMIAEIMDAHIWSLINIEELKNDKQYAERTYNRMVLNEEIGSLKEKLGDTCRNGKEWNNCNCC